VHFFVPLGSTGQIDTTSVFTNNEGVAVSGTWTLGNRSGFQTVRAHSEEVAWVFTAIALPDAPVGIEMHAGNKQIALAGTGVRVPPAVRVIDRFANGVPGIAVVFATGTGPSELQGAETISDSAGVASVDAWIVGETTEPVSIVATSPVVTGEVHFEARVVDLLFNIEVRAVDEPLPPRLRQALERAASRWMSVLSAHSGMSQVTLAAAACGPTSPAMNETITDILVLARVTSIDGTGNVLANAAACAYHEETGLPVVSRINFDVADLASYEVNQLVDAVATHELGHALGFGTGWTRQGLIADAGSGDPIFTGSSARREFDTAFGAFTGRVVPVENTGGPGTRDRHWRMSVFQLEIMNGFINSPLAPLSRITIGALEDQGYQVRYEAADPFPNFASTMTLPGTPLEMRHDERDLSAPRAGRTMQMVRPVRR